MTLDARPRTALRAGRFEARVATRIAEIDARAWDSVVSRATMRHAAVAPMEQVLVDDTSA
jgi:hypothetical protein